MRTALYLAGIVSMAALPAGASAQSGNFAALSPVTLVTDHALGYANPAGSIGMGWGGHQPRIVRDSTGLVSIVYLENPTTTSPLPTTTTWRLVSQTSPGVWQRRRSGQTDDDVFLLLAPNDRPTVIGYQGGIPYSYTGLFSGVKVPNWPMTSGYNHPRQYGGAGIGPDGTVCLKASMETTVVPGQSSTLTTKSALSCGLVGAATVGWQTWPYVTPTYRERHAYDYVHPKWDGSPVVLAAAQRDVEIGLTGTYSFNGVEKWVANLSGSTATSFDASTFYPNTSTATDTVKEVDNIILANGLMMSVVWHDPARTWSLKVQDLATGQFTDTALGLPSYGYARVVEPFAGQPYIVWTNRGPSQSQAAIYGLTLDTSNGVRYVLNPNYQSIAGIYSAGQMISGPIYVAARRGGTKLSSTIDAFFLSCATDGCPNYSDGSIYHFELSFHQ